VNAPAYILHGSTYIFGSGPVGTSIHQMEVVLCTNWVIRIMAYPYKSKLLEHFVSCNCLRLLAGLTAVTRSGNIKRNQTVNEISCHAYASRGMDKATWELQEAAT
jgi:hypothetical protein